MTPLLYSDVGFLISLFAVSPSFLHPQHISDLCQTFLFSASNHFLSPITHFFLSGPFFFIPLYLPLLCLKPPTPCFTLTSFPSRLIYIFLALTDRFCILCLWLSISTFICAYATSRPESSCTLKPRLQLVYFAIKTTWALKTTP